MAIQDLLKAYQQEEEPIMSEMAPADYENMQSPVTPDMMFSVPQASDIPTIQQQPQTPIVAQTEMPERTTTPPTPETELQRLERRLQELHGLDVERQRTASKYNFGAKAAAIIGDALSKYQTGAIQKNVGIPVQFTGPSLQQLMGVIGEVKAPSSTEQREALLKQYAELARGERAETRTRSQEKIADERNKAIKEAARIKASAKGEKEKGITPYQELMLGEKEKARQEKDAAILEELENRRTIVEQNVDRAKKLIKEYGTVELFGSEAEQLNGIMQEIATDIAKLQDPKSVARPSEVESIRKNLIPESTSARMNLSNKTAMDILDKFKERINERADIGYKVRGFDPKTKKPITQQLKGDSLVKIKAPSGAIREVSQQNAEEYLKRPGYSKVK